MESHELQGASTYLNNLLLARGLLSDGKPIDFAKTDRDGSDNDATTSRTINLVHDLVLRRDREAEQREILATSIRAIRNEDSQRLLDLQRLQVKNGETTRDLIGAQAQERALKATLRKTETQVKDLREQMAKMKSTLDQVRGKCFAEVRKKDVELEKLKGHLSGMQRGKREASGMKINTIAPQITLTGKEMRGGQDVNSTEWSLEKETNEFLAALVNETSSENVALREILGGTMDTLKELTALDENQRVENDRYENHLSDVSKSGSGPTQKTTISEDSGSLASCENLALQMSAILDHCRSILKDPSFVPLEEVQIREEEILKLRAGWEKMAGRWKEAVTMMDSWRKRMRDGNDPLDVCELSDLGFGRSVAVLPNGEPVLCNEDELSSILFEGDKSERRDPRYGDLDRAEDLGHAQEAEEEDDESELDLPSEPSPKRLAMSPARRGINLRHPVKPLREIHNGAMQVDVVEDGAPSSNDEVGISTNDLNGAGLENNLSRDVSRSKIPKQVKRKDQVPLSVSQKLAAVEAQAREAEATRKHETVTHKRKAGRKQPLGSKSRRRSTLSPEELASLMGVR